MTTLLRAGIAFALLAALGGGALYEERHLLPSGRLLPGLRVDGVEIPDDVARGDDAAIAAWIDGRIQPHLDRTIEVHAGATQRDVPLRTLSTQVDAASVIARLRSFGRDGTLASRIDDALRARHGQIDLPLAVHADAAAVEGVVGELKKSIDSAPTDARLDLAGHTIVPDVQGHALDFDGGVVTVSAWIEAHALDDGAVVVEVPQENVDARVTSSTLGKLDISTVIGTYSTFFGRGGDQAPRATNIEVAARKLDGLVMNPGELVSFNAVVGDRSEANGFKTAWEIFKGEMRPGVGGGTCQVASTFHAAVFFAGFDVLERLPHSRPSAYIPMGLDSTVVYPAVDLKVKNPYDFAVVVHTMVEGNKLTIELLGKEKRVNVTFASSVVQKLPYERRLDEEPYVKPGKAIKKQGGIWGYRIHRSRLITPLDGSTPRSEDNADFYPPTVEIYVVAPGTDPDALPAMPKDVADALAKKHGTETPEEYADAVACAGDCEGETKPTLEVENAPSVHTVVPSVGGLIKQ